MSDNITDTARRFEIFVPSPKARINMGAPNKDNSTGPFGYTGMSLQSDVHLFIDANKNTLYQTGMHFCGQVGAQWRQFSNGPMYMSATANVTLAADQRVIIASGAGQGQITAMDHGQKMRLVPYNELKLHHLVDSLQVGLFEFFNGRHTRKDDKFGLIKPVKLKHFFSRKNAFASLSATAAELENKGKAPHEGGFLATVARSWELLHNGVLEDDLQAPNPGAVPSLGPIIAAGIAKHNDDGAKVLEGLKYGYSGYLKRFDPYSINKGGFMNKLHLVVVTLKRFMHVALKYGQLVQDLPFIRNAIKGLEGVGNIVQASFQAYHAATDSYPALAAFERTQGGYKFNAGSGGVVDELNSGAKARVASVESSTLDSRKAKVDSSPQPGDGWPLAVDTIYDLNVTWADGSKPGAIRISASFPTPATMQITAPTLSAEPESFTLTLRVNGVERAVALDSTNTADAAVFAAALRAALADDPVEVTVEDDRVWILASVASDPTLSPAPMATSIELAETDANTKYVHRLSPRTRARPLPGMGHMSFSIVSDLFLTPPRLRATGPEDVLTLTINGTREQYTLKAGTNLAALLSASTNVEVLATASGIGNGPITLTTRTQHGASSIEASVVTAVMPSQWSFSASDHERGTDAFIPPITAADVVRLAGDLEGASVSVVDGKVRFEATQTGAGSTITVSGSLADLIFGSASKTDSVDEEFESADEAAATVDDAYKTIVSWNHELQKLPEDTRNLTRPLTEALDDTVAAVGALEAAAKSFTEVFEHGAPPPPESIGLMAPDGITLGTRDRIVASGGKGIVLISDGGTGVPDRGKFVLTESWVADMGAWAADFFESKKDKDDAAKRSLGFRVLSDSAVDLTATSYAQLSAMGRGAAESARADGRKDGVGIGVARVIGSYASEVAGYEKVVISARAPGDAGDQAGETGGRVEMVGQRLVLGAVSSTHKLKNGALQFFTDRASLGTHPITLDSLAGAEHMAGASADEGDKSYCKGPAAGVAWSEQLRKAHPETTHVDVHATTQLDAAVLPYRMILTKDSARLGIMPEDRRAQLKKERDDRKSAKTLLTKVKTNIDKMWSTKTASLTKVNTDLNNPLKAAQYESLNARRSSLEGAIKEIESNQKVADADLKEATTLYTEASKAYDDFKQGWKASNAYPVLEISEEKIRLGFSTDDGTWEDFAYLEMTKDGIKMFQPKAGGVATFDLEKKSGLISDGSADTAVEAKAGKLTLKYKNSAKSGPLEWDAQGNVKIG